MKLNKKAEKSLRIQSEKSEKVILELLKAGKFFYGVVVCKEDIDDLVREGDTGIITGWAPNDVGVAIWFNKGKWINFKLSEEEFREKFSVYYLV